MLSFIQFAHFAIRRMGLFRSSKPTAIVNYSIDAHFCAPITSTFVPCGTLKTGPSLFLLSRISQILPMFNCSEIFNSVVRRDAVDVVNGQRRFNTMDVKPSEAMGQILSSVYANVVISITTWVGWYWTKLGPISAKFYPTKFTSQRIVVHKLSHALNAWHFG